LSSSGLPDNKTRRYDRQLRYVSSQTPHLLSKLTTTSLWAATGQAALESARILVISGSATSTSILKNLVLPGIGHFTILDHAPVTPEDAGNNFFLEGPSSIGKPRAAEAVRLLGELNDGVEGVADTRDLDEILANDAEWFAGFTIVITHNLEKSRLDKLAALLWSHERFPPLAVIRSAGFLAEFYIQYREHTSQ
jgi:amyloid beta precursor protein binding protein 1